jgi:NAD(P)H-dependent FMN reductase
LRTLRQVVPDGVSTTLYDGLAELPAFNPDNELNAGPAVERLRRDLGEADAVLFCTPEYAGSLPGSFKNLLDWTVGTADLHGKPVAWVNIAAPGRGEGADATLATVLRYVGARIVDAACVRVTILRDAVGPDGTVRDNGVRRRLADVAAVLAGVLASDTESGYEAGRA